MKKISSHAHKTGSWFLGESIELVPLLGEKKIQATPTKQDLVLLGIVFKISDAHPRLLHMGDFEEGGGGGG